MLKYLRLVFTAGLRILWDWLFYILRYAKHPERYPLEKRYAKVHKLIVYVVDCYRVDFKVKGLEHLRRLEASDKPYLMCANHESNMDPIVMLYFCEKPISFVAKKETEKFPFVGKIIKSIDGLFMDRDDLRQSLRVMIELGKRLENGKHHLALWSILKTILPTKTLGNRLHLLLRSRIFTPKIRPIPQHRQ